MTDEHVTDLLAGYALGVLDGDDLLSVARHLPHCAECRQGLETWYATVDQIAISTPLRLPPASLRTRVVKHVASASAARFSQNTDPILSTRSPRTPEKAQSKHPGIIRSLLDWLTPHPAFGIAALLLILLLAASNVFLWRQIGGLQAIQATQMPSDMKLVRLAGTDTAPTAVGYLMTFAGENYGSLTVEHVPALDASQKYQIWLINDGKRTSGGVFAVNSDGYGVHYIQADQPLENFDSFGITIEPAAGSSGPTGKKVLGGTK